MPAGSVIERQSRAAPKLEHKLTGGKESSRTADYTLKDLLHSSDYRPRLPVDSRGSASFRAVHCILMNRCRWKLQTGTAGQSAHLA